MAPETDVLTVPASPAYEPAVALPPERPEDDAPSPHQEINARRARVENPELLRRLRGL
ncbi:hypothetical protein [Phenylobacterium sp.]|uniref:hypothetical protein n=1 Tax=Phenylobacterium sp. TaxID=1871053 RepID=UPI0035B39E6A